MQLIHATLNAGHAELVDFPPGRPLPAFGDLARNGGSLEKVSSALAGWRLVYAMPDARTPVFSIRWKAFPVVEHILCTDAADAEGAWAGIADLYTRIAERVGGIPAAAASAPLLPRPGAVPWLATVVLPSWPLSPYARVAARLTDITRQIARAILAARVP